MPTSDRSDRHRPHVYLIGALLAHLLLIAVTPALRARTELLIDPYAFEPNELWLIPALVILAVVAGLLPGLRAYRADVAERPARRACSTRATASASNPTPALKVNHRSSARPRPTNRLRPEASARRT